MATADARQRQQTDLRYGLGGFASNWFAFVVAVCTVTTTVVNIIIGLLGLGWLEWLWRWHDSTGF